jgi:hypothetical protein
LISALVRREYRIWASGRDELTYREGDHRVTVEVPYGPGDTALLYTSKLMRWSPPHDHELIPAEKRRQILERLIDDIDLRDRCQTEVVYS